MIEGPWGLVAPPASRVAATDVPLKFYKDCAHPECKRKHVDADVGDSGPDALTQCVQCAKPFCDMCTTYVYSQTVGTSGRVCTECASLPPSMDEGEMEDLMKNQSVPELRITAEQSLSAGVEPKRQTARIILEGIDRLCNVLRRWTRDEHAFVWSWRHELLAEDPSYLPPLVQNLVTPAALPLVTPAWTQAEMDEALNMLELARQGCDGAPQSGLYRALFVVVQRLVRDFCPTPPEAVLKKALELLQPCPIEELLRFLDPLVRTLKGLIAVGAENAGQCIFDLLCGRCCGERFSAMQLLLSLRVHELPLSFETALSKAMPHRTPSDTELQVFRFDSFFRLLLGGEIKACTVEARGHNQTFPLLTHGILSCGIANDDSKRAPGKTGSQIFRFSCHMDEQGAGQHEMDPTKSAEEAEQGGLENVGVMLKCDHTVMAERRAASAMQLMEQLVWEEPGMQELLKANNLRTADVKVSYRIVCLTSQHALIEMVPDAVTMRAAKTKKDRLAPQGPRSLREFLMEVASEASWEKVLPITCAISSVLSFVLHLGDRHDENVMVTPQGRYVHVDFGWQLGETPAVEGMLAQTDMRVDYKDVWDAVGQAEMKSRFFPAAFACFKALRRHAHFLHEVITDLAAVASNGEPSSDFAARYVSERLLPGVLSEAQAEHFIQGVILRNRDQRRLDFVGELRHNRDLVKDSISASAQSFLSRPCKKCEESNLIMDYWYHVACPFCSGMFCQRHKAPADHQCSFAMAKAAKVTHCSYDQS